MLSVKWLVSRRIAHMRWQVTREWHAWEVLFGEYGSFERLRICFKCSSNPLEEGSHNWLQNDSKQCFSPEWSEKPVICFHKWDRACWWQFRMSHHVVFNTSGDRYWRDPFVFWRLISTSSISQSFDWNKCSVWTSSSNSFSQNTFRNSVFRDRTLWSYSYPYLGRWNMCKISMMVATVQQTVVHCLYKAQLSPNAECQGTKPSPSRTVKSISFAELVEALSDCFVVWRNPFFLDRQFAYVQQLTMCSGKIRNSGRQRVQAFCF